MSAAPASAREEWRSHWPLVVSAMAGLSLGSIISTTLGLFMEPLSREFGWSRSQISAGMLAFAFIATPLTPFAGALVDRFGPRAVGIPGVILSGLAFAAFAFNTGSIVLWFGIWVAYALASLFIRTIVWNTAVSSSFSAGRGLALAVTLCGTSLATTFAPLIARPLIDGFGWRFAYAALGLGWGSLVLLLVVFFFHDARSRLARQAAKGNAPATPALLPGGLTLAQALRDTRMIRIGLAIFLQITIGGAVTIHLVPLLTAMGITRGEAAAIAAVLGIAGLGSRLVVGALFDRFTTGLIPFACFAAPAIAYTILLQAHGSVWLLTLAVALLGFASGGTLHASTYLTTRYAGVRHFGKIFGIISSLLGLAGGIGPLIAGLIYDQTGSYAALMYAAIPMALVAGLLVARLGPYPEYPPEPAPVPPGPGA